MTVDFGIYHHSTKEESESLRKVIRQLFINAFMKIGIHKYREIRVLDVGCGLGFLSYVVADYFPRARVLGIDTFEDSSLPGSSIEKAKENMCKLKIDNRVTFKSLSVLDITPDLGYFDLVVSNLVLHNLGEKRFEAYEKISKVMDNNSFFINGDLFMGEFEKMFQIDMSRINKTFQLQYYDKIKLSSSIAYYLTVLKLKV
ncbi:class I SAM-dependent methyltransferase [Sulfolobus sp. S-194]|uniref:class I SAM-dependent methyltransferase n=1 Tax=Sulfolobus sp. S-194 TaxID=2512240 RepID=UPI0014370CD7|nr:class I SAM-dependent methyltransferase [Sulfolobus sp. S-194]QIW22877.1 class I SAM-dependent methyltransferase [Sulfolobus sp. S-194]